MGRKKLAVSSDDILSHAFGGKKRAGRPKKSADVSAEPAADVADAVSVAIDAPVAAAPKKRGRPKGLGVKKIAGAKKPAAKKGAKKMGRPKKVVEKKAVGKKAVAKKAVAVSSGAYAFVISVSGSLTGFASKTDAEAFLAATLSQGVSWSDVQVFGVVGADPKASI